MLKKNLVFIGMPSSGKTTVGKLISELAGMQFLDTDQLITEKTGTTPREIVTTSGLEAFLETQNDIIKNLELDGYIVSTGGGVIYNDEAMIHLKKTSSVVFLKTDISIIESRLTEDRRLARSTGQSFHDMYLERMPLYSKYADIIIDCNHKSPFDIATEVMNITGTSTK